MLLELSAITDKHDSFSIRINHDDVSSMIDFECENREYTIFVADDDKFVRSSSARILNKVAKLNGIKIKLIEFEDGVDVVYNVIDYYRRGKRVDIVISDETMQFLGGREALGIMDKLVRDRKVEYVYFCIVTAYHKDNFENNENVFSKPLTVEIAEKILENLHK